MGAKINLDLQLIWNTFRAKRTLNVESFRLDLKMLIPDAIVLNQ